jgi:colanic acid/amylovoran biosynthesis glycosyltransferase
MSRPLRVGYLSRYLPSPSETFVLDEALAVRAVGVDLVPIALDRVQAVGHARFAEIYESVKLVPRASSAGALYAAAMLEGSSLVPMMRAHWSGVTRPRDLRRALWLARYLRSRSVDVLRVHHAAEVARYAVVAGLLAGVPVSIAVHARDLFVPVDDLPWILSQSAHVTTVTPFHRERLLRSGLPSERVALMPCAVAVPVGRADPPAAVGPLRIVTVGRLVTKKGHDLLIAACSLLAESGLVVQLVIVGEGLQGLALRREAAAAMSRSEGRLEVEFRGVEPVEAVEELLLRGRFHAFALACRVAPDGDRDGLPVSLLEAQAAGVPTVTSGLPGFESMLRDGRGGVILPLSAGGRRRVDPQELHPADLAQVLRELYDDDGWRDELADGARTAAELRATPEDSARRLVTMLASLVEPL